MNEQEKYIMIKNIKSFIIIWFVVLLLNQIFIFHACFALYCITSALPHTGIIAFILTVLLYNENKEVKSKIFKNQTNNSDSFYATPKATIDISFKDTLNISLTPDIYLSEKERRKRKDVIAYSSSLLLNIVHQKDNPHDSNAILVSYGGIKIGYIYPP